MKNRQTCRKKKAAFRRGVRAENLAAFYLRLKFYSIVARRFKTRLGEIDLIARRGALVAVIEVKARPGLAAAHDALDKMTQTRLAAAADLWLMRQRDREEICLRFDLVIMRPWRLPHHVKAFFTI